MKRFELATPTQVTVIKFQTRSERHGDALVTAADLRISWQTSSDSLDMLHPGLRAAILAAMPDGHAEQGALALEDGNKFVRFKDLKYPLRWEREYEGWTTRIDYGASVDGSGDMIIGLCKLHNFDITPMDGGTVEIDWTISSSADLTEETVGYLGMQQQKKIVLSLLAPNKTENDQAIDASSGSGAPGTGPAADDGAEKKAKPPKGAKNNDAATQAFIAAHGADGADSAAPGETAPATTH